MISISRNKKYGLSFEFVSIIMILMFLNIPLVAANMTASLSISHSNTSPAVQEYDTVHAYVSWSEMNGMDGYKITLMIPKTARYTSYYDSPTITEDTSGSTWNFEWFWGTITDTGSNNLCYVNIQYLTSGTFTTILQFTVYQKFVWGFIFWVPKQTWQISSSWYVSSGTSSSIHLSETFNKVNTENTSLQVISYSTVFNNTTIPKILKALENSEEFANFKNTFSENFSVIFGVKSEQHVITALLIGYDTKGNKAYKNIYIPLEIINTHIEKVI